MAFTRFSAYLPNQGVVLAQIRVDEKSNEMTHAPTLLRQVDLRGVVVSGDAMFDQRELSIQIVQAKGDSHGTRQGQSRGMTRGDRRALPAASQAGGTSAPPNDFRTARTVKKGHGRLEKLTITGSHMLTDYSTWPHLAQVFKRESQRTNARGLTKTEMRHGVTSLPVDLAGPKRLLELTRRHWGIGNGRHDRRDATLREDHAQLRMGHAPQMLAVLNNTILGLFARHRAINVAEARRSFAYHFDRALTSLMA